MSLSDSFIRRPVLTTVCSLIILLGGLIILPQIGIEGIPSIAPPTINISAQWQGASAEAIEQAVTVPLEQAVNGVDNIDYITSSSSQGSSTISVFFKPGTDPDINQVNINNKANQAASQLPPDVRNDSGVSIGKSSDDILAVIAVTAENKDYDLIFLTELLQKYLKDEINQVNGIVKPVDIYPSGTSFNIYIDASKLNNLNFTSEHVITSLRDQNIITSLGSLGKLPSSKEQKYEYQINTDSLLKSPEEIENVILSRTEDGNTIKLKDIGKVEYGFPQMEQYYLKNKRGKPSAFILIKQQTGSNALKIMDDVHKVFEQLKAKLPPGISIKTVTDNTEFISDSIDKTVDSLIEAIVLVIAVLFLFLRGNWRPTLVTAMTIPVSLVGTLIFIKVFGYSLNQLTLLGMVISVGLVVDDAIVVVEKTSKNIELGMKPRRAAISAMNELFGAVITTSLVLIAVFLPSLFNNDATGIINGQFAITIIFTIAISTFNALTFSPMLCGLLLSQEKAGEFRLRLPNVFLFTILGAIWGFSKAGWTAAGLGLILGGILGLYIHKPAKLITQIFGSMENFYGTKIQRISQYKQIISVGLLSALLVTILIFPKYPSDFVPQADRGYAVSTTLLNANSPGILTAKVMEKIQNILNEEKDVREAAIIIQDPTNIISYVSFIPINQRKGKDNSSDAIMMRLKERINSEVYEGRTFFYPPSAVPGFGTGFSYQFVDQTGNATFTNLSLAAKNFIGRLLATGEFSNIRDESSLKTEVMVDINRDILGALNIDFKETLKAISSQTSNNYSGRTYIGTQQYTIYLTGEATSRSTIQNLEGILIKSRDGVNYPLSIAAKFKTIDAPSTINHYNLKRAISLSGNVMPGTLPLEAYNSIDQEMNQLGNKSFGGAFTGLAKVSRESGDAQKIAFSIALVTIYLVLAAQYESFFTPMIILITVPIAALGAIGMLSLRNIMPLDIFGQFGITALIGLAAKNSILIVERADQLLDDGEDLMSASALAAKERLRPIIMTSIASLAGFFPLVIATGAGAVFRNSIGNVIFGGVLLSTILTLCVVPTFYIIVKQIEFRIFKDRFQSIE